MKRRCMSRRAFGGTLLGGAVLLAGIRPPGPVRAHSYRFEGLAVGHLYAPPTGTHDIAVFGPLVNTSDRTLRLVAARAPEGGRVRFRRVEEGRTVWLDALELAPNRPLALAPWREHLWVEGLPRPLAAGETFELELEVGGRPPVVVTVVVEEAGTH